MEYSMHDKDSDDFIFSAFTCVASITQKRKHIRRKGNEMRIVMSRGENHTAMTPLLTHWSCGTLALVPI